MNNSIYIVTGVIVGMVVGYLIGKRKGRPVLGALLGILGCVGWIVIAVLPAGDDIV